MRSVRKGDWKLIKYETLDGKVEETQLFNLAENPQELLAEHHASEVVALTGNQPAANQIDLADEPNHAAKRKEMEALLLSEMERHHDPYRFGEGYVNPLRRHKNKNRDKNRKKDNASKKNR